MTQASPEEAKAPAKVQISWTSPVTTRSVAKQEIAEFKVRPKPAFTISKEKHEKPVGKLQMSLLQGEFFRKVDNDYVIERNGADFDPDRITTIQKIVRQYL